jgi:hypothetical protein
VPPHLERTHRLIGLHVEDVLIVCGPCTATPRGVEEDVVEVGAAVQVADAHRVALAAVDVAGPGEQVVVGADLEHAQGEVVVALGLGVLVEQDLLRCGLARATPAVDAVAEPLLGARRVPPAVLADGGGEIGLLDTGLDLLEHRLHQRGTRCEPRIGVRVLGLQVGNGVGIVAVAEPRPRIAGRPRRAAPFERDLLGNGCFHHVAG